MESSLQKRFYTIKINLLTFTKTILTVILTWYEIIQLFMFTKNTNKKIIRYF